MPLRYILYTIKFLCLSAICCCSTSENSDKYIGNASTLNPLLFPIDADVSYGEPYLYTDQVGTTYLSWRETKNKQHELRYAVLDGDSWSIPKTIAKGENWFVNWADYPQLVSFANGELMSFFLEKSGDAVYAYDIKIINSENQWQTSSILHDDGKIAEHGFVSMVPYEDNAFIAWLDGRNTVNDKDIGSHTEHSDHGHGGNSPMTLRGAVVDGQGKKLKEWELDNSVCDCCQTSSAMTKNGPVVIYRGRSISEVRNINIVRNVKGEWTAPQAVYDDNWKIKGCPVNGPRSDAMGNTLGIAWFAEVNTKSQVKVIFSEDGGASFLDPIIINSDHTLGRVDFILLDENEGMVSWMEGADILSRKVDKNGNLGNIIKIATSSENRSSGFPQMTKTKDKIIFAWTDSSKGAYVIKSLYLEI